MKEYRFYLLLVALTLLLFAAPLMRGLESLVSPGFTHVAVLFSFVLMLVSAVYAVARTPTATRFALILAGPLVILECVSVFNPHERLLQLTYLVSVVFLTFVIIIIVRFLFTTIRVNGNIICAAICVYLLMGVLAAIVFSMVASIEPDAFAFSSAIAPQSPGPVIRFEGEQSTEALYFSFVTLTTLGYGDITPKTPAAKMLVSFEAVVGQLFLAVLVARLVGMHIATSSMRTKELEN